MMLSSVVDVGSISLPPPGPAVGLPTHPPPSHPAANKIMTPGEAAMVSPTDPHSACNIKKNYLH